jgi:hypothetical protein
VEIAPFNRTLARGCAPLLSWPRHPFLDSTDPAIYTLRTTAPGPTGRLPLDREMLRAASSGNIFGMTQNAGMGWDPRKLLGKEFLILSTQGGIRAPDGSPVALGYHTGHWEVGLLMEEAARAFRPGRDSVRRLCQRSLRRPHQRHRRHVRQPALPQRRRDRVPPPDPLAAQLPRRGRRRHLRQGPARDDDGARRLAPICRRPRARRRHAARRGGEDTAKVQTLAARFAPGKSRSITPRRWAAAPAVRPAAAASSWARPRPARSWARRWALAAARRAQPVGRPIWRDMARRSALALLALERAAHDRDILTDDALHNAMVVHAAFGGSTNLVLHVPAIAHAAGLRRPTVDDWARINRQVPRLVDVLPNGPTHYATVQVFLAGGVPEVMLHLRDLGLLKLDAFTVTGQTLGENLAWWEKSERRARLRAKLRELDGIDPDEVILAPARAGAAGLTSTVTFLRGNLAPEGALVKSTAIAPSLLGARRRFRHEGPARVFGSEAAAIAAIKSKGPDAWRG